MDVLEFEGFVDVTKKEQSPMTAFGGECFVLLMWHCNYIVSSSHLFFSLMIVYLLEVVKRNLKSFRIFSPDGALLSRVLFHDHFFGRTWIE